MKCKELYNNMDKLCDGMNKIVNNLLKDDEYFKDLNILSSMLSNLKGYLGEMKNEI